MEEKPWDRISVIEICKKADITRGTFYQYFGDIYDLVEQLEHSLLEDLKERFSKVSRHEDARNRSEDFLTKFDYSPPASFLTWFTFCRDHRDAMMALLHHKNGDPYFIKKLKNILRESIEIDMDRDGTAKDFLRSHFLTVFMELHILSAQTWLESRDQEDYLSVEDIVNLLNTMRVGSVYLAYKSVTDPSFEERMSPGRLPELRS
jgi:AcrR family transcriptional regulator